MKSNLYRDDFTDFLCLIDTLKNDIQALQCLEEQRGGCKVTNYYIETSKIRVTAEDIITNEDNRNYLRG